MKKKVLWVFGIVFATALLYFVGTGFIRNTSAYINDFSVSADGKEITVQFGVSSSAGYIREITVRQQHGGKLYLDCWSAFGGLNGSIGAKDTFSFSLYEDTTVIAVYRKANCYEEVLEKAPDGFWRRNYR